MEVQGIMCLIVLKWLVNGSKILDSGRLSIQKIKSCLRLSPWRKEDMILIQKESNDVHRSNVAFFLPYVMYLL